MILKPIKKRKTPTIKYYLNGKDISKMSSILMVEVDYNLVQRKNIYWEWAYEKQESHSYNHYVPYQRPYVYYSESGTPKKIYLETLKCCEVEKK